MVITTDRFRKAFTRLPKNIQKRARQSYQLWKLNNNHPGLHFKQVHNQQPVSVPDESLNGGLVARMPWLLIAGSLPTNLAKTLSLMPYLS